MTGPNRCARDRGTVEQIDGLLYVIREEDGTLIEAGVEEFVEMERLTRRSFKITLRGETDTKPLVLMLEAESPVVLREYGRKVKP